MGPAPLPPHERSWRHPSELAASERQTVQLSEAPASTRAFAMVTGTIGLLAVGALMLTVTPRRDDGPVAVSATTPTRPAAESFATGVAVTVRLATPIGDGQQALMTASSGGESNGAEFDVQLTSGPVVTAVVSTTADGIVVLSIASGVRGHTVAAALPAPDEIVTVLANPPVTVAFADVASVDADEGTPVLDDDGALVGLCTLVGSDETMSMLDVTADTTPSTVSATTVVATSVDP